MKKIMFNDKYGLTKAVLEGRKTMTRRIMKPQPTWVSGDGHIYNDSERPTYKIGEIVAISQSYKECGYDPEAKSAWCHDENENHIDVHFKEEAGWTNKMFVRADRMKHHIRITDIKVERLCDISDEDCIKEGLTQKPDPFIGEDEMVYCFQGSDINYEYPSTCFAALIDKVSGKGTWDLNPFVFAYSFKLVD